MVQDLDRLSDLPDSLLISIMSLLTARDVVRTCVLSKRWRYLWASVPCLHFESGEFGDDVVKFNHFVSCFLNFRNKTSSVHTFKLNCHEPSDTVSLLVKEWVLYACKHKVKNLEVGLPGYYACSILGNCLLSCDSLEDVHLNGLWVAEADSVYLPKLRNMSLCLVSMIGDSMQKVLSGCPALETLSMKRVILHNRISFQNVKRLTLENCFFCYNLSEAGFSMSAPCIKYLKLVRRKENRLSAALMDSSNEGNCLDFHLLSGISGVETLELFSIYQKEMLVHEIKKGTTFNNLRHLVLSFFHMCCDLSTLSSFLKHCPNLETLCFMHPFYCKGSSKGDDVESTLEIEVCACQRLQVGSSKEDNSEYIQSIEACACQCLKLVKLVVHRTYPQCCVDFLEEIVMEWIKELDGVQIISFRVQSMIRP